MSTAAPRTPADTPADTPAAADPAAPAETRAITWFEIPVGDLARAQRFYETVLGRALHREQMGPHPMAVFAYGAGATGGCLMSGSDRPAAPATGVTVYLSAEPSLDAALERAAAAGGRVVQPRTELPPGLGAFAHVVDPDGNRVGLHALA